MDDLRASWKDMSRFEPDLAAVVLVFSEERASLSVGPGSNRDGTMSNLAANLFSSDKNQANTALVWNQLIGGPHGPNEL
jgi:hypothetical protein